MGKFFGFIALFATSIAVGLLRALVLSWLWLWFVVPLGVPQLSLIHAFGLVYVTWMFLLGVKTIAPKEEDAEWWQVSLFQLSYVTAGSLTLWGFGYIIHLFM